MQSGESVDLLGIVDGLKLSAEARAPLAQTLEDYELELDRALQAKQKDLDQGPAFEPGKPFSPEDMKKRMDDAREAGQKVKEVNQRSARKIEAMLPDDVQPAFNRAVREATYPRVYRPSPLVKRLDAALGLADLDSGQRETLQNLKSQYTREVSPINDRWASAIDDSERSGSDGTMAVPGVGTMQVSFGGDEKGPLADARKARRELDDRTREKLESTLSKEQRDRLPKESQPMDGVHDMGGGGLMAAPIIIRKTEDR
jgi:hypothetical protein